ncbi:tellurite resistance TerB family protein [Siccirubricoccus sp. G192]|uniref:tellurite resistance TerB family protein n=1 Tax=Siccirubricoccus sp. G192 TaxID=2849651 RepID=UPI001C2C2122|nr:tellurite resistance TerB family protein [Siccirubricoccus sp. G192]MBV1796892.1 tellurite resistance TerB family protein [Siccirubricoccus sp. G192]
MQRKALLMLRAMIQAAKSDGQIDAREMERITSRLDEAGEDREARDFVLQQLRGPVDIDALARDVTSQQDAAEVYAASFMAIEVDTDAERDYLARLATALNLPREAVERIHASLNVPA